jgi:hypothetical protein
LLAPKKFWKARIIAAAARTPPGAADEPDGADQHRAALGPRSISAPFPECCCGDATKKSQVGLMQCINSKEVFIHIMDRLLSD